MKIEILKVESKGFTLNIRQRIENQVVIRKIILSEFDQMVEFYNLVRILYEEENLEENLENWFKNSKYLKDNYKRFFEEESYLEGAIEVIRNYFDYDPCDFAIEAVYVYHLPENLYVNVLTEYSI